MVSTDLLMQSLISGVLIGALYALFGLGISLIWGLMRVCNFAHGAIAFLGAYFAYTLLAAYGLDPVISLVISIPFFFVLGVFLQKVLIEPITGRVSEVMFELVTIVITFGLSLVMESLMILNWTSLNKSISVDYFGASAFSMGAFFLPTSSVVAFAIAIISIASLFVLLEKTHIGLGIRATSQDREAAGLVGINVNSVSLLSSGIAYVYAAFAGISMGLTFPFTPSASLIWCVRAFIVVVLGGIGSIPGTLVGGLILGVSENLVGAVFPFVFREVIALAIFIVFLLLRPSGLLRRT